MTRRWASRWAITACMVVAACGGTPGASSIPAASQQTETTSPSAATAATPTPTLVAASPTSPTPRPARVVVRGFARITVAELNVRTAPSLTAPRLMEGNADAEPTPVRWGTKRGTERVFVFDGPVDADGYQWWQVFPTSYDFNGASRPAPFAPPRPDIGWVAAGDKDSAWLIPANECPESPIELAEITSSKASWGVRFRCFEGRVLTLRGWLTTLPPEDAGSSAAAVAGQAIFPVKMGWYDEGNVNRLDFRLHPQMNPTLPAPEQWVEVTGSFDDPTASQCESFEVLECQATLTVTSFRALGP